MKMKTTFGFRWLLLFLILVSGPVLACGLFTDDSGDISAAEVASGDEVDAPESSFEDAEAPAADRPALGNLSSLSDALASFNSYRIRVEMRFEDAADPSRAGVMTMNTSRIVEPPASAVEMSVSGAFGDDLGGLGDGTTLSFVEVGGTSYSIIPGVGCISGAGGDMAGDFDDVLDTDELIEEIEGAEYVGEETVNGVATYHYRFDESGFGESELQLREGTGDLYVSQEHGYVVRMVIDGTGEMELFDEGVSDGHLRMTMDVTDVGQPIVIEPPAECDLSGSDFPVMAGARNMATFAGLTTYEVDAALNDVVSFYETEMSARGYQVDGEPFVTDSTALMTFRAEGLPTVSVTLGADSGTVSVLIAAEEN
jgi:hypothetical protein